jgi:hypothetical protein
MGVLWNPGAGGLVDGATGRCVNIYIHAADNAHAGIGRAGPGLAGPGYRPANKPSVPPRGAPSVKP